MEAMSDFSRQVNIFKPEEFKTPITIIGAGATGSWLAFSLAKMGITNITIYDFDEVGMHNLPNQMFGLMDIDKNKAMSIQKLIRRFTGFNIKARNKAFEGHIPLQGIVFVLTDTMKSRKDIFNMCIKNNPMIDLLIETRMDLRGGRIYAIDPKDKGICKAYEKTLYGDDEAEVSACGVSQTVLPSAIGIVSNAMWKLLNHINGEIVYNETIIDFSNEIIMTSNFTINEMLQQERIDVRGKYILCKTKEEARRLHTILKDEGIKWCTGDAPKPDDTRFNYDVGTVYIIDKNGYMSYCDLDWVSNRKNVKLIDSTQVQ